jgi:hypothetical protein
MKLANYFSKWFSCFLLLPAMYEGSCISTSFSSTYYCLFTAILGSRTCLTVCTSHFTWHLPSDCWCQAKSPSSSLVKCLFEYFALLKMWLFAFLLSYKISLHTSSLPDTWLTNVLPGYLFIFSLESLGSLEHKHFSLWWSQLIPLFFNGPFPSLVLWEELWVSTYT